jgi:Putative Actinobacterial Holin-X, holin superfamily III
MAILQALFALLSKSAGKILNAIFGWAVRALFGRTSPAERTFLSALVGMAAAWPLLVVGIIAPKLSALVLAFVPIPKWVPSWIIRLVWVGLAVLVPLAVGIAIATKAPPETPRKGVLKRLLSGFPITIGLALAFLIMFVSVPVMRLWAILKGQTSADVPLVTTASGYHVMAAMAMEVLNRHGFKLRPAKPGWWVAAPVRVLRIFGGNSFGAFVPQKLENYEDADLAMSCYPSGIFLRGHGHKLTWAHGLIAEASSRAEGFQTSATLAQDVEKQLRRLWKIYSAEPEAHTNSTRLLGRLEEITTELATIDVDYEDWQILYRQILQLGRALHGQPQLLDEHATQNKAQEQEAVVEFNDADIKEIVTPQPVVARPPKMPVTKVEQRTKELSTLDLVKEITTEVGHLAEKQIALAKAELRADLKAEATMVGGLGAAALAGLATLNLLLVTGVLALARLMPAWTAGLVVSGAMAVVAGIVGFVAWNRRVRNPLQRSRRALKEDVQWAKERVV